RIGKRTALTVEDECRAGKLAVRGGAAKKERAGTCSRLRHRRPRLFVMEFARGALRKPGRHGGGMVPQPGLRPRRSAFWLGESARAQGEQRAAKPRATQSKPFRHRALPRYRSRRADEIWKQQPARRVKWFRANPYYAGLTSRFRLRNRSS